jgi:molybdopterin molybdotransferase
MISYEEARAAVLGAAVPGGTETVALDEAFRRVLAADLAAPVSLPPFDNSAMDGYALLSGDTVADGPVILRLAGESAAGAAPADRLLTGSAVRIMTGAPVPPGADAVVAREAVEERASEIVVSRPVAAGANIRRRGEDIQAGGPALRAGSFLDAAAVGFLAALGFEKLRVHVRPRVAIITTGSEIRDAGQPLGPGAIYDSNSHVLKAQLASAGASCSYLGRAADDLGATVAAVREALRSSDVVLTTGGVSMGDYDLVRDAFEAVGAGRVFWKVAQKPGMPLAFYEHGVGGGRRWLFGLPGNPGAVMISFEEYVRPFLARLEGRSGILPREGEARLAREVRKKKGRLHFFRVRLVERAGEVWAEGTGEQGSGILSSMLSADALALIPAEAEFLPAGTVVRVHRVGW